MTETRADTYLADAYLKALAAPEPTPGGGSASAVVAAIGTSLLEMVASLSEQSAEPERKPPLSHMAGEYRAIRERLSELGAADERAYGGYRDALSLPKGTPEEKSKRREALQSATIASANAPLAVAELALETLRSIPQLAGLASPYLRSDLATAAHLLSGAAFGAIVMVDTNLGSIRAETTRQDLTARRDAVLNVSSSLLHAALEASA